MDVPLYKPYIGPYYDRILACIENPTLILSGYSGSVIAVSSVSKGQYLHVVYREVEKTMDLS